MPTFSISTHQGSASEETAWIHQGLDTFNNAAAPLHEVQALSCFAHTPLGKLIGGAIGRCWGSFCELQQLWVEPSLRRQGIGSQLLSAFETLAQKQGCTSFYLETFSFQAPKLYELLGYCVAYEHRMYPHGIVKYIMVKHQTHHSLDISKL